MSISQDVYEVRPRKDRRGIDLIGEQLLLGMLWFEGPEAIDDAVTYARASSYPHPVSIRLLDEFQTLAVTLELTEHFSGAVKISAPRLRACLGQ